jgi:hypothetical protein
MSKSSAITLRVSTLTATPGAARTLWHVGTGGLECAVCPGRVGGSIIGTAVALGERGAYGGREIKGRDSPRHPLA